MRLRLWSRLARRYLRERGVDDEGESDVGGEFECFVGELQVADE
jgi:hypothetical protein